MSAINAVETAPQLAPEVTIRFAVFSGVKSNVPRMETASLNQFLAMFEKHAVLADKASGKPWSPTIYREGASRRNADVEAMTALVIDVDDGTPFSSLETRLKPFRYVMHTSYSHTPGHPKYRVVLPLAAPIAVTEWPSAWRRLSLFVDGHADPATKDPARLYFLPGMPPGAAEYFVEQHEGRLITIDDLPRLPQEKPVLMPARRAAGGDQVAGRADVADVSAYEAGDRGLEQVLKRCHFMQQMMTPENQNDVPEPLWMAMLSNACRFRGGREFAHAASCYHDDYTPAETDARLARYLVQSGPMTCSSIQERGFAHCPAGGCVKPSGEVAAAPAALGNWPDRFEADDIPHPIVLKSFVDSNLPGGLVYTSGEFHCYRAGAYDQLDEAAEIEKPLAHFLGAAATANFVRKLKELLAIQHAQTGVGFVPNLHRLCLTNGTLNLETFELEPHSPDHKLRTRLDVAWDRNAACLNFLAYLDGVFQPDADKAAKIAFVQQWLGYLLVPDTSMQKMVWLVGAGANGKSVLLSIINALAGEANISHAMLDTFDKSHVRAELDGKLVNIAGEMAADSMINDGYIKAIVAGDTIEASRKYKPSMSFRPFCRLMAATNNLPRTNDLTHGFFRRTIILTFNRKFAENEQNPSLVRELLEELPGILVWAVEGLRQLRAQGRFSVPPSSATALEQYRAEANPVMLFANECLTASPTSRMSPRELRDVYAEWCRQYGFAARNMTTFGKALSQLDFENYRSGGKTYWRVMLTQAGREYAGLWSPDSGRTAANDVAVSELVSKYGV